MKVENTPLDTQPIFLVGAERSGTTLLRIMLNHHPKIAFDGEFEYAVDHIPEGGGWPPLDEYHQWLEINHFQGNVVDHIDRSLSYPQLIESFLRQRCDRERKPIIGATVHRNFDKLLLLWQNARFIHILRDGRDVARSCIGMGWAGNVWTGVERWIEAELLWVQLSKTIEPQRRIEVIYEDLILEPVKTLTRLCNFIGVPYDQAMLSYPQKTTYDLPTPSLIRQWQSKLSDYEIQLLESRIGNMLVERGYELSGLPPLNVTSAMEKRLKLQSYWWRLYFRIKRHGLLLFLSDYFSRSLGLKQWQKRVKPHLAATNRKYIK